MSLSCVLYNVSATVGCPAAAVCLRCAYYSSTMSTNERRCCLCACCIIPYEYYTTRCLLCVYCTNATICVHIIQCAPPPEVHPHCPAVSTTVLYIRYVSVRCLPNGSLDPETLPLKRLITHRAGGINTFPIEVRRSITALVALAPGVARELNV